MQTNYDPTVFGAWQARKIAQKWLWARLVRLPSNARPSRGPDGSYNIQFKYRGKMLQLKVNPNEEVEILSETAFPSRIGVLVNAFLAIAFAWATLFHFLRLGNIALDIGGLIGTLVSIYGVHLFWNRPNS